MKQGKLPFISATIILALMRVARRWNQTGQKHAGEPDIARTMLPNHKRVLWVLVLATYFNLTQQLARTALSRTSRLISTVYAIALCVVALGYKVAFTKAEAPELLAGFPTGLLAPLDRITLVVQARAVFIGIGTLVPLMLVSEAFQTVSGQTPEGIFPRGVMTAQY